MLVRDADAPYSSAPTRRCARTIATMALDGALRYTSLRYPLRSRCRARQPIGITDTFQCCCRSCGAALRHIGAAAETMALQAKVLPVSGIGPVRFRLAEECSERISPRHAISALGCWKRRMPPSSQASNLDVTKPMP